MSEITKPAGWLDLLDLVSENMSVSTSSIFQKTRKTDIVLARRMFCVLATRTICRGMSQREIVEQMGDDWDDRSILSYYERCHRNEVTVNKKYKSFYKKLLNEANIIHHKSIKATL